MTIAYIILRIVTTLLTNNSKGEFPLSRLRILLDSLWHLQMSYTALESQYSKLFGYFGIWTSGFNSQSF